MFGVSKPICPEASLTHDGTRLLHQRSKRSGKQRVSRKAAAPWSRGCCRSGVFALDILSSRYSIGLPGGGAYAPHKCFAASKTLRRGNLFTPSIQIPRTGGRLRRPEPKKKDTTFVVSFFLQRTVKIDIFVWGQRGPQLTKQDRSAECQFPAQG